MIGFDSRRTITLTAGSLVPSSGVLASPRSKSVWPAFDGVSRTNNQHRTKNTIRIPAGMKNTHSSWVGNASVIIFPPS